MSAAGSVAEEECFLSPTMMRGLSSTSAESATDADDPPAFADAHAGQPSGNQHATTVGVAEEDDSWKRSGSGRDLSSDELLHLAMAMAEQAVGQAEDENEAEAATWSPRQRQWLDGVDTGPSAAVSEMQAVEDDLAWRLQSTLWCPPQTPVTAQGDMDDFVHEQTPVSGGTSRGDCQAESEESEESELPEFIVQLEQAEVEFYRQLLSKGRHKLEYSKLMIMGPGRVGKTSMLRKLTGECFDAGQTSTRGVDACSVDVHTWRPSSRGDTTGEGAMAAGSGDSVRLSVYRDALADELAEREIESRKAAAVAINGADTGLVEETPAGADIGITMFSWSSETSSRNVNLNNHGTIEQLHSTTVNSSPESTALRGSQTCQIQQDKVELRQQEQVAAAVHIQSAWRGLQARRLADEMRKELTDPDVREAIAERVRRRLDVEKMLTRKSSEEAPQWNDGKHGRRLMTVLDFAGQRMYYVMHHVLMSKRLAVYIVCMSLASDPDALIDGDEGCSASVAMTELENLHFWLNSIAAQAPNAPILVVATHADVVDAAKREAVVARVEASFVDRAFERQLVGGGIHCISCVTGYGIDVLRQLVEDTAVQLPDYGTPIPLGWLRFCEQMHSLVAKGTLRLQLTELRSYATACSISTTADIDDQVSELGLCLRFFTDVGLLMHHDTPNTRDLVVLKPQWLLDSMRELCDGEELLRKSKLLRSVSHDVAPEWRMLLRHGRLDAAKLSRHVWAEADPTERAAILALMERFGLCALLPHHEEAESYVVPSLLPEWSRADINTQSNDPNGAGGLHGGCERAKGAALWTDENSVVAIVRSIHHDAYWEDQPPSFLPEAVFFSLQVSLLRTLGAAADVRACRHLYRDRALFFGDEDYYVHRVASEQLLRIVVRVETGHEPACVARRVISCLEGEADTTDGIAARFGLKFQLVVDCKECGAPCVVADHCGEVCKCPQCRSNQAATVNIWCHAPRRELRGKETRAELGPTLREAVGRGRSSAPLDSETEQELRPTADHGNSSQACTNNTKQMLQSMLIPWSDLELERRLGEGGFGVVMKMKFLGSTEVAVKALTSTDEVSVGSVAATEFLREMEMIKSLHHPNVIQLLGVTQGSFCTGAAGANSIPGSQQWMLVTEFMRNGSLHDWLHINSRPLRWRWKIHMMVQVAQAMVYLHADLPTKPPIVHLDLKPANILISGDRCKVADFGLSIASRRSTGSQPGSEDGGVPQGTIDYMAPEMYLGTGVGIAADVYAFAIMMWEVEARIPVVRGILEAVGRPNERPHVARALIPQWVAVNNKRPRLPAALQSERQANCPPNWVALMEQCWKAKPRERLRFPAVVTALQRCMQMADTKTAPSSSSSSSPEPEPEPQPQPQPEPQPEPEPEPRILPPHQVQVLPKGSQVPQMPLPSQDTPQDAPQPLQSSVPPPLETTRSGIWAKAWQFILAIFFKLRRVVWLRSPINARLLGRSAAHALDRKTAASGNFPGERSDGNASGDATRQDLP